MKSLFLLLATAFTFTAAATSMSVSGFISSNQTWNVDTVKVTGDTYINSGYKVIIAPGTRVEFQGFWKIEVYGSMEAIGNVTDTIVFTYFDTTGFKNDFQLGAWRGLIFDYNTAANDSTIMDYCTVEYCKRGSQSNTIATIRVGNNNRVRISHCEIRNNNFYAQTGGIFCIAGSPLILDNHIHDNVGGYGGGINVCLNSNPLIRGNVIDHNYVEYAGGGIYVQESSPMIMNNIICNNTTKQSNCGPADGSGGIRCTQQSYPYIVNNVIANNTTGMNGGGVQCMYGSHAWLENNTIVNNNCYFYGGGIYLYQSVPIINNCIIWGNTRFNFVTPNQIALYTDDSDPNFYHCDIQDSIPGFFLGAQVVYTGIYSGCIASDPLFVAPSAGAGPNYDGLNADWRLQSTSPCVNSGVIGYTNLSLPTIDLWGNPRFSGWNIDIGAYEDPNASSIGEFSAQHELKLFPVPAGDELNITLPGNTNTAQILVFSAEGKVVSQQTFSGVSAMINTSAYDSGFYTVEVRSEFGITRSNFIRK